MRDEATDRRYPPIGSRSAGSCPQRIQDHVGPCEGPQSGLQMQTLVAGQESQQSGASAVARPTLPSATPPLPRFQGARLVRVGSFDHLVGAAETAKRGERTPSADRERAPEDAQEQHRVRALEQCLLIVQTGLLCPPTMDTIEDGWVS